MNTREKGNSAERERKKQLEADGYLVLKATRAGRFGSLDFWGVGDLLGLRADGVVLEQVKCNTARSAAKQLREWAMVNKGALPSILKLRVAIRIDGSGGRPVRWRIVDVPWDLEK